MNWQCLKYFETVAQEEHFTKAAEKLFITQSALSKSINHLEAEIGVPLFERDGRNIKLTLYGQLLSGYVSTALSEVEEGLSIINRMTNSTDGIVRISSVTIMVNHFIPNLLKKYTNNYPNMRIEYYQKPTTDILDDIINSKIDIGFCGEFSPINCYRKLEKEAIHEDEIYLAVPTSHPLAKSKSVTFQDIENEDFVGYNLNTGIIQSINTSLERAGISKKINFKYSTSDEHAIIGMVRANLGVAFVTNHVNTDGVRLLHITKPFLSRTLYMVWKKDTTLSPAAKTFKYFVLSNLDIMKNQVS